jgi:recombination protein RecA
MHDEGISRYGDILDLGVDLEVIDKRGSYYYYADDTRLAQGRENAKEYLAENTELAHEIEEQIRELVMERSPFPHLDDDEDPEPEGDED